MWNSSRFPRSKPVATESSYPTYGACSLFYCFYNPPNSDMDYTIFNVRMWSLRMRMHTVFRLIVSSKRLTWEQNLLIISSILEGQLILNFNLVKNKSDIVFKKGFQRLHFLTKLRSFYVHTRRQMLGWLTFKCKTGDTKHAVLDLSKVCSNQAPFKLRWTRSWKTIYGLIMTLKYLWPWNKARSSNLVWIVRLQARL